MRQKVFIAIAVVLLVAGLVVVPAQFNPQGYYRIHVGADFYVMHVSPELQTLSRRMSDGRSFERLIAGQITRLTCGKLFAVGSLDTSILATEDFRDLRTQQSVPGYFVLDIETGRLHVGLDEEGYRALAGKYQQPAPELKPLSPTRRLSCNFVLS